MGCGYNTAGGNQGLTNTTFGGKSGTVSGHHSGPPGMTGNYASGAPTQYHHRATAGWNSAPLPAQQYRYGTGPVTQTTMSPYTSYNPNPTTVSTFCLVLFVIKFFTLSNTKQFRIVSGSYVGRYLKKISRIGKTFTFFL